MSRLNTWLEDAILDVNAGSRVSARGIDTVEVSPYTIEIENPRERLVVVPGHEAWSLPFAVFEAVMLFSQTAYMDVVNYFGDKFMRQSGDGLTFQGSYGPRLTPTLEWAIGKIGKDRSTRQAVVPIFQPADLRQTISDVPCTQGLQFLVRDEKLNLHVTLRSSDVWNGLRYDVFQFTLLQEIVANELCIDVGKFSITAGSAHIYARHAVAANSALGRTSAVAMPRVNAGLLPMRRLALMLETIADDHDLGLSTDLPSTFPLTSVLNMELMVKNGMETNAAVLRDALPMFALPFSSRWG